MRMQQKARAGDWMTENSVTEQVLGSMNGADILPSSLHHLITPSPCLSKRPLQTGEGVESHQFTFALSSPLS